MFSNVFVCRKSSQAERQVGNVTNISLLSVFVANMPCFVTSCCEGVEAKLRGFSDAPLSRGVRNVTWQDVFCCAPFTSLQTHYKYKFFSNHDAQKYLFSSVSLLSVAAE